MMVLLLLIVLGLGHIAVRLESAPVPAAGISVESQWVRTTRGWETLDSWGAPLPERSVLHPGLVAAGQLGGSLLALVAWGGFRGRRQETGDRGFMIAD